MEKQPTAEERRHVESLGLKRGDWISNRMAYLAGYEHHSIYLGGDRVIGSSKEKKCIIIQSILDLANITSIKIRHRGDEKTAREAENMLNKKGYDVLNNNCEQFCTKCFGFDENYDQAAVVKDNLSLIGAGVVVGIGLAILGSYLSKPSTSYSSGYSGFSSTTNSSRPSYNKQSTGNYASHNSNSRIPAEIQKPKPEPIQVKKQIKKTSTGDNMGTMLTSILGPTVSVGACYGLSKRNFISENDKKKNDSSTCALI